MYIVPILSLFVHSYAMVLWSYMSPRKLGMHTRLDMLRVEGRQYARTLRPVRAGNQRSHLANPSFCIP